MRVTFSSCFRLALGLVVGGMSLAACGDGYNPCDPPARLKGSVSVPAYCTENDPPSQPQVALATPPKSGTIELAWTVSFPVADAYLVERSVNGGAFSELRRLTGNVTFIADADLKPETRYAYRVTASRVNALGKTVSRVSDVREAMTPSAADLGGDTVPTGSGKQIAIRVVKNRGGGTTTYACLPRENNIASSGGMVNGDVVPYAALDPSKKATDLAIDCLWAVAPNGRIAWIVSNLSVTSSADLSTNTAVDGTGIATTIVVGSLGDRPYRIFDPSAKLVLSQSGTSFAELIYDNGAVGVERPLAKGVSGVTPIEGSGVLK